MRLISVCWAVLAAAADADHIVARAAENMEKAAGARTQFVYQQAIRSSLVRSDGTVSRREKREYSVIPNVKSTGKKLVSFSGEYRDGIPPSLFPLRTSKLSQYKFQLKGTVNIGGRPAHHVLFEPSRKGMCVNIGGDDCDTAAWAWRGEVWIDQAEMQPVRIQTELAFKAPWAVRTLLGTNFRQTGFSVGYRRVAENVWFPVTYGTEFRMNVPWGYKRTVTLSLESGGFKKADAASTIQYAEIVQ